MNSVKKAEILRKTQMVIVFHDMQNILTPYKVQCRMFKLLAIGAMNFSKEAIDNIDWTTFQKLVLVQFY